MNCDLGPGGCFENIDFNFPDLDASVWIPGFGVLTGIPRCFSPWFGFIALESPEWIASSGGVLGQHGFRHRRQHLLWVAFEVWQNVPGIF